MNARILSLWTHSRDWSDILVSWEVITSTSQSTSPTEQTCGMILIVAVCIHAYRTDHTLAIESSKRLGFPRASMCILRGLVSCPILIVCSYPYGLWVLTSVLFCPEALALSSVARGIWIKYDHALGSAFMIKLLKCPQHNSNFFLSQQKNEVPSMIPVRNNRVCAI